jgi:hypothetical protein
MRLSMAWSTLLGMLRSMICMTLARPMT